MRKKCQRTPGASSPLLLACQECCASPECKHGPATHESRQPNPPHYDDNEARHQAVSHEQLPFQPHVLQHVHASDDGAPQRQRQQPRLRLRPPWVVVVGFGMHNHAQHLWPFWHTCLLHTRKTHPSHPCFIGCWGSRLVLLGPEHDMPVALIACTTGLSPNLTEQLAIKQILLAFIMILNHVGIGWGGSCLSL